MSLFSKRKVAAAVRTEEDFQAALDSQIDVIFLHGTNLLSVEEQITRAHEAGKKLFIHMDFADGIGKDRVGLEYVKLKGADGILSTKTSMIRQARDLGLVTVHRFFIVDSHSVDTAVDSIRIAKPDIVEIMPGVVCKKIVEFAQKVNTPILVGGLVEFEEEVDRALEAGAKGVSTAARELWDYK
ncbi:MAG: glycerol-3-phosphate responsive antiterminator [Firmicutes bacterium]|nr:glycerol-3-phosphate responsive antiterminator [Bacillota bacterium]